jgi:hypothetical protein
MRTKILAILVLAALIAISFCAYVGLNSDAVTFYFSQYYPGYSEEGASIKFSPLYRIFSHTSRSLMALIVFNLAFCVWVFRLSLLDMMTRRQKILCKVFSIAGIVFCIFLFLYATILPNVYICGTPLL